MAFDVVRDQEKGVPPRGSSALFGVTIGSICSLVTRIEKIAGGVALQRVERAKIGKSKGLFVCLADGSNKEQVPFATLDEVADYLTTNPGAGVRMNPGWSKVVDFIHIDGRPR